MEDYQEKITELTQKLKDPNLTSNEATQYEKELVDLLSKSRIASAERNKEINGIIDLVVDTKITLAELIELSKGNKNSPFSEQNLKAYCESQGWLGSPSKTTRKKSEAKPELIVGEFVYADYVDNELWEKILEKNPTASKSDIFVWDWNKSYGNRGWERDVINAIASKGKEAIQDKLTDEFKAWLEEKYTPTHGAHAGKVRKPNEQQFDKFFNKKVTV